MVGCAVINCSNSTEKGFRLFRFPTDPERRSQWERNCRRENWNCTRNPNSRICEVHFEESQYESNRKDGWKKLRNNALPTIINAPNAPKPINFERKSVYKIRPRLEKITALTTHQVPLLKTTAEHAPKTRQYKLKRLEKEALQVSNSTDERATELNTLYNIGGSTTNMLLKTVCNHCCEFLQKPWSEKDSTEIAQIRTFKIKLTKGGLKEAGFELLSLIFNCEIIHNEMRQFILTSNSYDVLINKIVNDVHIFFPICICNIKYKIVQHFFTIRSYTIVNLSVNLKRKIAYGTASSKKKKIS